MTPHNENFFECNLDGMHTDTKVLVFAKLITYCCCDLQTVFGVPVKHIDQTSKIILTLDKSAIVLYLHIIKMNSIHVSRVIGF
jgi:hypothetical protein